VSIWDILGVFALGWLGKTLWDKYRARREGTGGPLIHPEAQGEFPRIFAEALLDAQTRKALVPLLKASGNNVTGREIVLMKYLLGKYESKDAFVADIKEIAETNASAQDALILNKQLAVLKSVLDEEKQSADS